MVRDKHAPTALVALGIGGLLLFQLKAVGASSLLPTTTYSTTLTLNMVHEVVPAPALLTRGHKATGLTGIASHTTTTIIIAQQPPLLLVQRGNMRTQLFHA